MSQIRVLKWEPLYKTPNTTIINKTVMRSVLEQGLLVDRDLFLSIGLAVIGALIVHSMLQHSNKAIVSGIFSLVCLVLSTALAPVIGVLLLIFSCYRQIASIIISLTCKKGSFAGLMDGTDAIWAIEDEVSHSIINVLALVDPSLIVSSLDDDKEPLQTIRDLIMDRILCSPPPFPKLMYFRKQSHFGYYYWERQSRININEHIRFMDMEVENGVVTENAMKGYISSVVNLPLPENHKSNWEILVGRYPVSLIFPIDSVGNESQTSDLNNKANYPKLDTKYKYPILFRIHHSLGDGVALVNLLMDTLSDPFPRSNNPISFEHLNAPEIKHSAGNVPSFHCLKIKQGNLPIEQICTNNFNSYILNNFQQTYSKKLSVIIKSAQRVCSKFLKFIEETNTKSNTPHFDPKCVNIIVNNQPGGEFLEIMKNSILTENSFYSKRNKRVIFDKVGKINNKILLYLQQFLIFLNIVLMHVKKIVRFSSTLFLAPACIFIQGIMKKKDVNIIHGPKLSGYKVVAWYFEQEDNNKISLMTKIQRIRSKTGVHFSDVILTALSTSLELFFKQCNKVPHDVTVVIPARLITPPTHSPTTQINAINKVTTITKLVNEQKKDLCNKFSVALLTLPIASQCSSEFPLFSKLEEVCKQSNLLRNSPDYIINYWLLKIVATLFPPCLLSPIVASTQSSLVLSNIPGPTKSVKFAGHTLHDLVFWVPNKGTTGVGVTILSYAGRLQLGVIADCALIPCQQDLQLILNDLVSAIHEMNQDS